MKLADLTLAELEAMTYDDLAYQILEESNSKLKLADLFKKICNLLNLSDAEYENKIIDFFDLLTNDQRFIMLENGYWDKRSRHTAKIVIDDAEDDDDIALDILDDEDEEEEETEEDIFYDSSDESDDTTDDDLKDLIVVDDEESGDIM